MSVDAAIAAGENAVHDGKNGRFWLADRPDDYNKLGHRSPLR